MIKRDTYKEITSGGGTGATQTEIYEIFEGTNTQGLADSLFENLSGGDTPLANLLVETTSGNTKSISNVCFDSFIELASVNSNLQNIDSNTNQSANYLNTIDSQTFDIASYSQNIQTNTNNTSTYLSTIRTPVIISTSASATISGQLHNISFYNSGSSAGTITVNGTTVNLPAGVTVNYDAGGNNNRFPTNVFSYNATGTTFIISYVN